MSVPLRRKNALQHIHVITAKLKPVAGAPQTVQIKPLRYTDGFSSSSVISMIASDLLRFVNDGESM